MKTEVLNQEEILRICNRFAFQILENSTDSNVIHINLGTGNQTSILQLIKTFEFASGKKIKYEFCRRRSGDTSLLLADVNYAKKVLNWRAKRTLFDMCKDSWNYAKINY